MFKRMLLLLTLVLFISLAAPNSAQIQTQKFGKLTEAAKFFPSSTMFYFAIRTDGDYINALNEIIVQVQQRTIGSPISLPQILDMLANSLFLNDFQNDVAPWLGDAVALGVLPYDSLVDQTYYTNNIEYGIVINITDRNAATQFVGNFINSIMRRNDIRFETNADFIAFYLNDLDQTRFIITNTHLVITNTDRLTPPTPSQGSLFDSYAFEDALNPLPGDAYNFIGYVDLPTIQSYQLYTMRQSYYYYMPSLEILMTNLFLSQVIGPIAIAGTIENGNVLILDGVWAIGNTIGIQQLGLSLPPNLTVTPEFADVIPSDAIFAIHGASPLAYGTYLRDSIIDVWQYLSASEFNPEYNANIETWVNQSFASLGRITDAIFSNLTGLSLQQDFANWLSRDMAFFIRSNPELDNPQFPIDFAFVSQVTDGAQSLASIRRLVRVLPLTLRTMGAKNITFIETNIAGADALVVNFHTYTVRDKPSFELIISANDAIFVVGTQRAVRDVLAGQAGNAFPRSQAYILANANIVLYDNLTQALPFTRWIMAQRRTTPNERQLIEGIVNLLGEGVISISTLDNGTMVMRAVQILNLSR